MDAQVHDRSAARRPPVALSIAGSDPSGGAGIQADLKTFSALGAYGTCVITALTAQNTQGVTGVLPVPTDFVAQQLDTLLEDVRIDAVKIGMLGTAELAALVGDYVRGAALDGIPIVLDPVMVATSGDRLLEDDAVAALRALLPHVDLVTPNLPEAAVLTGSTQASDLDGMRAVARGLRKDHGARAVYLKGGHLPVPEAAIDHGAGESDPGAAAAGAVMVDLWLDAEGELLLTGPRVATDNTHGTGCTLSSALAALRPRENDWRATALAAKAWLTEALAQADVLAVGHGHGPVHHFHESARWR